MGTGSSKGIQPSPSQGWDAGGDWEGDPSLQGPFLLDSPRISLFLSFLAIVASPVHTHTSFFSFFFFTQRHQNLLQFCVLSFHLFLITILCCYVLLIPVLLNGCIIFRPRDFSFP